MANGRSGALLDAVVGAHGSAPALPLMTMRTSFGLERLLPALQLSDHVPFWRAGIPAVLWTDTAMFRNRHYHEPTDLPHTLDYRFMRRTADLLLAALPQGVPA